MGEFSEKKKKLFLTDFEKQSPCMIFFLIAIVFERSFKLIKVRCVRCSCLLGILFSFEL